MDLFRFAIGKIYRSYRFFKHYNAFPGEWLQEFRSVWRANDMSYLVAHNLSGLYCRWETTNETDNMVTGDQAYEIHRSLW